MPLKASIRAADSEEIAALLTGVVALNLSQLRGGRCPPLNLSLDQGIRYEREKPGREDWQTAVETWKRKRGDCEDLSTYLAASLQLVGVGAEAAIIDIRPGLKHCVVRLPSGEIIDPSRRLGMKSSG